MTYIPSFEIKQPSFHADELGFVFKWNGHLLRGIYHDAVPQAKRYFESGFVDEIVKEGLFPKTWISDYENEQFGLIIEHQLIEPVTYATEWNFQMLKDAALMVLDIAQIGQRYGYDMIDCHKLNVMFYYNKPMYVDLGSFVLKPKGASGWRPFASFLRSYYYIIDVWQCGSSLMAKRMMSPHVELDAKDYYSFKGPIYRHCKKMEAMRIKLDEMLCGVASLSDVQIERYAKKNKVKGKIIGLFKGVVSALKLAPSQHLKRYKRRIGRMELFEAELQVSQPSATEIVFTSVINDCFPNCEGATIINSKSFSFYYELLNNTPIKRIYSIQEEESLSSREYKYYQTKDCNIASLNFKLTGGEILLRNKFPEDRFATDLVLLPDFNWGQEGFALHNAIVRLKLLMKYTKNNTMILSMKKQNEEFLETLKKHFEVKEYGNCLSNNITMGVSCLIINALQ